MSGQIKILPIIGRKFGKWTVISDKVNRETNKSMWYCECECGVQQFVDQWSLHNKQTTQCKKCGYVSQQNKDFENFYNRAKHGAITRNINFSITIEDIKERFEQQLGKCALTGIQLKITHIRRCKKYNTASLDRIDSNKGYEVGNIQWVHKNINKMKLDLNEREFIELCSKIVDFDKCAQRTIKLKKTSDDAIIPTIGTNLSACYDLSSIEDVEFKPGEVRLINTGIAVEPPSGFRVNIYIRSSTPKRGFILANSIGICDEDYRGTLFVQLLNIKNDGGVPLSNKIYKGDRIAQFELVPSYPAKLFSLSIEDSLSITQRGEGGFGSTGN